MKKEVFIAIVVGFSLGIIITFGVYTARKSINQRDQQLTQAQTDIANTVSNPDSPSPNHTLNLTSPAGFTISNSDEIQITGITSPQSMIAAISSATDAIVVSDSQGNFSIPVTLEAGENIITVTAYDLQGSSAATNLHLIYTTAELNQTPESES